MIAALISIYLVGFLIFGSFVVLVTMIGTLMGTSSAGTYVKLLVISLLWPLMILWGASNVFYKRIIKGEKPRYSRN